VNVKDKYEVREQGWLEKCKKLKAQVAQVTKESLEYQQVLNLYMDQFKTIQHMLENQEGNYAHPLSFSSLFQVLKERTDQISMQCTQLHNQLLDTKHQVEQTLGQLEYEKKKSDSLDHQQLTTIEKLEFLKEKQIEVEQRNKMLEHELQETIKQKQQLNKKFQLVIEKTAQFIQNEME
jgi:chromosome segregation ATPase